jgi:hypothetical protein
MEGIHDPALAERIQRAVPPREDVGVLLAGLVLDAAEAVAGRADIPEVDAVAVAVEIEVAVLRDLAG